MDGEAAIARARALAPWHFDFEIAPGFRTGDANAARYAESDKRGVILLDPNHLREFFGRYYPDGLAGKAVLDVGCNAGGYCFLAAELGAARVTGFDARRHWIDQAEFIKSLRCPEDERIRFTIGDAKTFPAAHGPVDVTIFKGVLYHLPDPVHVLLELATNTRETILVDTASSDEIPEACWIPVSEGTSHLMSGLDGLAWRPGGPAAVRPILEHAGFRAFDTAYWVHGNPKPGHGRFQVVARR